MRGIFTLSLPTDANPTYILRYICEYMVRFCSCLFVRAPFVRTLRGSTEEGRPDTVVEVWARSVKCVARGVHSKLFFAAKVENTISGFEVLVFFISWTACHNSGFPVQGQVWGTASSKFGRAACRVPCVTRACAVCNAMLFFSKEQETKTGRRSK